MSYDGSKQQFFVLNSGLVKPENKIYIYLNILFYATFTVNKKLSQLEFTGRNKLWSLRKNTFSNW
jgi:hypothetical protein